MVVALNKKNGSKQVICNGLISDWLSWQFRPSMGAYETFKQVLKALSPQPGEITLEPGEPTRLPPDDRDIPTLKMPYGDVPVVLLSAGIKRILSLAYILVWTWERHKIASTDIKKKPLSKIVFIIDEMESHLHPRWQRLLIPSLISVINLIEKQLNVQLIASTHSPLVMASVEPIINEEYDKIFTLDLVDHELEVQEVSYVKYGSINSWLTSKIFNLDRPYSIQAERALIDAKELQLANQPDPERVREISKRLLEVLPDFDPFWPRWKFFAEKHGVEL